MSLPLSYDYAPMEAQLVDELPVGENWQYEPKWDGFRCLAFRDGDEIELRSKSGQPLARYFPDVVEALLALEPKRFVLDGEIVVPTAEGGLSFDDLLLRIHPAASRIGKLSKETPATLIVFDLLVDDRARPLVERTLAERRDALEQFASKHIRGAKRILLSPAATSVATVEQWQQSIGSGLDGTIAKRLDLPYRTGDRTGMRKVKFMRTADCVVGGFRYASKGKVVGSLLLGLYDEDGLLHHVGFTSGIKAADRAAITRRVEPLKKPPGFTGRAPGGPSRWSTERSAQWEPLRAELVVEVQYDHFSGGRFRHGTRLLRWRPDKAPRQCTMDQVLREETSPLALAKLPPARAIERRRAAASRKH